MVRSQQKRINAYFGRTVEEIELWEFLLENHPDNMAAYLKYYARLGMIQVLEKKGLDSAKLTTNPIKKRTREKTKQPIKSSSLARQEKSIPITPEYSIQSANDLGPLDLELKILEIDPTKKTVQGFNRFIPEEDDEEILELLKNHTSMEHDKS